jgi:hypothetical protein
MDPRHTCKVTARINMQSGKIFRYHFGNKYVAKEGPICSANERECE